MCCGKCYSNKTDVLVFCSAIHVLCASHPRVRRYKEKMDELMPISLYKPNLILNLTNPNPD